MDHHYNTYLLDLYYPLSEAPIEHQLELCPEQPEQTSTPLKQRSASHICKMIESKKASNYYWTDLENTRYLQALKQYANILNLSVQERRLKKVNLLLSRKIRTRSPLQCHSHHQKMMAKYGSLEEIMIQLELKAKQNGTLWREGQNKKRRGRPSKQPKVKIEAQEESLVATTPLTSQDDRLFEVLELSKYDLEQQEVDRFLEQHSIEYAIEDPAMEPFFWL